MDENNNVDERDKRLAEALRTNLLRRKQQHRMREEAASQENSTVTNSQNKSLSLNN